LKASVAFALGSPNRMLFVPYTNDRHSDNDNDNDNDTNYTRNKQILKLTE